MAETPDSGNEVNEEPKPKRIPSPKRGAIPTPRGEIEKAKPYVPDSVPEGGEPAADSPSREHTDQEPDGEERHDNS
jgi:hypothetical protein